MAAVQRTAELHWTGSIARGSGRASGGSGALSHLPITLASRFGEPEADAASFDRAAHKAERSCPVSRALQGNVEISVHATLDEPSASWVSAPPEA
jgi:uncharacterized OsmC-like protein